MVKEVKTSRVVDILSKLNKGKNETSFQLLDGSVDKSIRKLSSGILSVDLALGGGYGFGRVIEAYGHPSGGKSTITLHAIAEAQKNGGVCALIDSEHCYDPSYANNFGINSNELLISQPDCGEEALKNAMQLCEHLNPGDLIVVDSVAALTPKAEIEGEIGDQHVGLQARMMSQALRMLTGTLSKSQAIIIFVNQVRDTIGGMGYGPKTTTPGGNALKFYASQRIEVTRVGSVKKGEEIIGNKTKIKVTKNKLSPPFREAQVELLFGKGFDYKTDIVNLAVLYGLVKKSGSWLSYNDQNIGQGVANVVENSSEELIAELVSGVKKITGYDQ